MTRFSNVALQSVAALAAAAAFISSSWSPGGTTPGIVVLAMVPNPNCYNIEQPNGEVIEACLMGSEEDPYEEDTDGYTIIGTGPSNTEYKYGVPDPEGEEIVSSGITVSEDNKKKRPEKAKHARRGANARAKMGYGGTGPSYARGGRNRTGGRTGRIGGRGGTGGRGATGGRGGTGGRYATGGRRTAAVEEEVLGNGTGIDYTYVLPEEPYDHINQYEHWDERVEDFHRRTTMAKEAAEAKVTAAAATDTDAHDHQRKLQTWVGSKKNLVIPMRFADHVGRVLPTREDIEILMNANSRTSPQAPTGSVRMVMSDSSYGLLDLESVVVDWITLPETEAYYANGNRGLTTKTHEAIIDALAILDTTTSGGFNFQQFDIAENGGAGNGLIDAICFLHSGYGAEWGGTSSDGANYLNRMWSHKWAAYSLRYPSDAPSSGFHSQDGVRVYNYHISPGIWGTSGNAIGRIGVIAHETGHFFGLPDLYDTGGADAGSGIGSWGLMANSWGFNGNQQCPPIMNPWSKINLGWTTVRDITTSGSYTLTPSYYNADVIGISVGFPQSEFLLIEYRKRTPNDFEYCLPTDPDGGTLGGLAIYHIDNVAGYNDQGWPGQAGWPENGLHYRVALLQADGLYSLEKNSGRGERNDLWRTGQSLGPGNGNTIFPNTDSYQDGVIQETGIVIDNIVMNGGNSVTFDIYIPGSGTPAPTTPPTISPTQSPTESPTKAPTDLPTKGPTSSPIDPTVPPTVSPTKGPTEGPTLSPIDPTMPPTDLPTTSPTLSPTLSPIDPTMPPTDKPTEPPTKSPTDSPTETPTKSPTKSPTESPTKSPTESPTKSPTKSPTAACGDGICSAADEEDCISCPQDCISGSFVEQAVCGNGICEDGETCNNCSADCARKTNGKKSSRYCCSGGPNGDCSGSGCGSSCTTSSMGTVDYCCGDGFCDGQSTFGESNGNCSADCA